MKPSGLPPLSARLLAVTGLVTEGLTAADVGCDHGYTAITLRLTGRSPGCICTDVGKGPLAAAAQNIKKYGASGIRTVCADGLSGIAPGEAECIIISGMGGELICRILREGMGTVRAAKELILGPQSEPEKVRGLIYDAGFDITDEVMIAEDGKYYPLIKAQKAGFGAAVPRPDETALLYGPLLLAGKDRVLLEFLEKEERQYEKALASLEEHGQDKPETIQRKERLLELTERNRQAQEYYR